MPKPSRISKKKLKEWNDKMDELERQIEEAKEIETIKHFLHRLV